MANRYLPIFCLSGAFLLVSCDDSPSPSESRGLLASARSSNPPAACDTTTTITGRQYNVVGSRTAIRHEPSANAPKLVNQKATRILEGTHYVNIDDTAVVFEECTKGGWSWIRVVEPDWLQDSHRGWVESSHLDKGQDLGGDAYARKISSSALLPYTRDGYPKTVAKHGSRLEEIESLRRRAAEMAADSGKCDLVTTSDLSDAKSTLSHLHFWVDCRNGQRIRLDEFEIRQGGAVLTQEDKAWTESSAREACIQAIKSRAVIPSKVDIHSILGTSFYKAPTTHNVVLKMDFDAVNSIGNMLPYTATCYLAPGEVGEIEIVLRD